MLDGTPTAGGATDSRIANITQQPRSLNIEWDDGRHASFHFLWLRDNCPSGFHADTQERTFDQLSVTADIHPLAIDYDADTLNIDWSEGEHRSTFCQQWLRSHAYSGNLRQRQSSTYQSWNNSFINNIPEADNGDIMQDDKALFDWMTALDRDGLAIVRNMPITDEAVVDVAQRIDYLRRTNFGVTFNVISVPNPINLAYTSIALPLHTDLANQEVPPGYQFLHCLANDSEGGASVFVDGLRVLEDLRGECPEDFRLLAEHAIPFRFHDEGHDIRQHHPVINLNTFGEIVEIKYNAHLADIFDLPEEIMHEYYLAYRNLMGRLRDPRYTIKLMLNGGDMVVFDNRRVMHGRDEFDPSTGTRHLRGCYVDRSEFQSRLRVLGQKYA
ncbi:TauD/TfdA family dioxygenase [Aliamphritea spongicola]|uniref:TauD/TfdA family dioxygenase n=1 Tax=Aliamphritea spongicola TaxID=707589 RepID=UPI00196B4875|nr:TauD/TfdA family dioxygenase [Aliamphritea spongicola]MBN3564298.1 TauD/TfdA family dioxygenase [Aliamphritea spongicola]